MTKTRVFVWAVLLLTMWCGSSQSGTTGKIMGQVTDNQGNPLPGAAVVIEGIRRGEITDEEGVYFILHVEPGLHTLIASMVGYKPQRVEGVRVTSDYTTNLSYALEEAPIMLGEIVVEAQPGSLGRGVDTVKAQSPPVEPDRTMSLHVISGEDIVVLPAVRKIEELVELQAGVSIDAEGDEILVRGGQGDTGYYVDGVWLPTMDHARPRVYRDINRLAVQEITIVVGGGNAEYGNAQGGIVSVVTRQGSEIYHGLLDYQMTPPGKKHWGKNVYESPIHLGNVHWDDPVWASETVPLPDGGEVLAHRRRDYTGVWGHYLEGNLSGPITEHVSFFTSSRWRREAASLPSPFLYTPFNTSNSAKLTYQGYQNLKVRAGGFYDRRRRVFDPAESYMTFYTPHIPGSRLDVREGGVNLFLSDPTPAGESTDTDYLVYADVTHLLSNRAFYKVQVSRSVSRRDTVDARLPEDLGHISEAIGGFPINDRADIYTVYRDIVAIERFMRDRLILKADLSSQYNRRHYLKGGVELTRYNNWHQFYYTHYGGTGRAVTWYGKGYKDTDFFPGQQNRGVTPVQLNTYVQDKIEMDGMVVNAGMRYEVLYSNTWVTEAEMFYGSPMWNRMTRAVNAPVVKQSPLRSWNPRLGISHPVTDRSVLRFFYGKFTQLPSFGSLFSNFWVGGNADADLNNNGNLDVGERWQAFDRPVSTHGSQVVPEETVSFEAGLDWNFVSDYVLSLTTYYKQLNNMSNTIDNNWRDPEAGKTLFGWWTSSNAGFRDTRGFEINLKKQFSHMFAFNAALNIQWAEGVASSGRYLEGFPDSLFIANGHYWTTFDVDPSTGAEIPVSLREVARREYQQVQDAQDQLLRNLGRDPTVGELAQRTDMTTGMVKVWLKGEDPDYYVRTYGSSANDQIRARQSNIDGGSSDDWNTNLGHHAAEGVESYPGEKDVSFYDNDDKAFWARLSADSDYPGEGEGNLMASLNTWATGRANRSADRRTFGSLSVLFATPAKYGPLGGKMLGNLRANLIYRLYTGTPFEYTPAVLDPTAPGGVRALDAGQWPGPMHTRVDLNAEKKLGNSNGLSVTMAVEVYNLFNQKDVRSAKPDNFRDVDFKADQWQQWGIQNRIPTGTDPVEIYDLNNYWDAPREMAFSVRIKW